VLALVCPVLSGASQSKKTEAEEREAGYAHVQLFTRVMATIREHYVDGSKVSYKELTYGALKGMLAALDPHSQFLEPEDFSDMRSETEGQFGGVGIEISARDGAVVIVAPKEGGPAFKAGIQPGDRIVRVDGQSMEKSSLRDVVKKLKGDPGTPVKITVMRGNDKEIKDFSITRDIIRIESVKDVRLLESELTGGELVGYIRITQFNEPTADEFENALRTLESQSMGALILDLRNNPGGLLASAADVAGKFIPAGEIIVTTEGRNPAQRSVVRSPAGLKHSGYPIAVLVNTYSASGAEIVAGALKDLKKAILIGETTFGKGSVQSVLPLPDESAIRLTTAKYYTPSHQVIHEQGVAPSIQAVLSREEEDELLKLRSGATPEVEKAAVLLANDEQLTRAVHVLKGIQFYTRRDPVTVEPAPEKSR